MPAPFGYAAAVVAAVAGITAYAGFYHLLVGVRRPKDRVHLSFSVMCIVAACWAAWGLVKTSAPDLDTFIRAVRWRNVLGGGIGVSFLWFLGFYTHTTRRAAAFLWTVTAAQVAVLVAGVMSPFSLSFSGPPDLVQVTLPWGERIADATGPTGFGFLVLNAVDLPVFAFGVWAAFDLVRRRKKRRAMALLIALAALSLGVFGVYKWLFGPVPGTELAFLGLIVVMSLAMSDEVVEASVVRDALVSSEQRLRILVENAPEAVVLLDVEMGRAVEANDEALRLFQIDRDRVEQLVPAELAPPEQADAVPSVLVFERKIRDALEGGRPIFRWVIRGRNGQDVPCEARLVRLPGEGSILVRLSLVDLQEIEAAQARQAELEEQLHQAAKMEAVGRLTGGVAHDFNNFLTVMQGNLELLLEGGGVKNPQDRRLVEQALLSAERSGELTQRLLMFSRKQPLQPRPVDLFQLMRGITELLSRSLGESYRIQVAIPEDLWTFEADPAQLESAIVNLAINARDAMPGGGDLSIEARNEEITGTQVTMGPFQNPTPGDYVEVTVRDTGHGMDAETIRKAVDPFFTTKEVGKGSGLGLSMVYGFVVQSGGAIRIDSEVGRGTAIRMFFPRWSETTA